MIGTISFRVRLIVRLSALGMETQFSTVSHAFAEYVTETYDYHSILHYDRKAFTKNGQNTIEALRPEMTNVLGRGVDLSEGDLNKVRINSSFLKVRTVCTASYTE